MKRSESSLYWIVRWDSGTTGTVEIVEIVVSRLESALREDWEKTREGEAGFPTFTDLSSFLEKRVRTLEAAHCANSSPPKSAVLKGNNKSRADYAVHQTSTINTGNGASTSSLGCGHCKGRHFIGYCPTFLKLAVSKRVSTVKDAQLCGNCLRPGHTLQSCPSGARCKKENCCQSHHTVLHPAQSKPQHFQESPAPHDSGTGLASYTTQVRNSKPFASNWPRSVSLLPTALVVFDSNAGTRVQARALLDPAAECSFLTERMVQALSLPKRRSITPISVVGEVATTSKFTVEVGLRSLHQPNFFLKFSARVLDTLTSTLPKEKCQDKGWSHWKDLDLADPDFLRPAGIDCILGAEVYPALIQTGLHKGRELDPVAQKTALGWVCTGPAAPPSVSEAAHSFLTTTTSIAENLQRFWELEVIPTCKLQLTPAEEACENHFARTHSRDKQGRYSVRLPFSKAPDLPGSRHTATARFMQLEILRDCVEIPHFENLIQSL